MARSLRYHPLFDSDALDAAEWYDGRQPNLGADFLARVRKAVNQTMHASGRSRGIWMEDPRRVTANVRRGRTSVIVVLDHRLAPDIGPVWTSSRSARTSSRGPRGSVAYSKRIAWEAGTFPMSERPTGMQSCRNRNPNRSLPILTPKKCAGVRRRPIGTRFARGRGGW